MKYTPYELVFGRKPHSLNIFRKNLIEPLYNVDNYAKELKYRLQIANSIACKLTEMSKIKSKKTYDKNLNKIDLDIGDSVVITNEDRHKLQNLYSGPYKVTKLFDKNIEILDELNGKTKIIHKNRVRKYNK